ncbi:MAG: TSUP family transporter [Gammaproteobacteria bacterium]|nr:TSUP family transporter [Gammaproteobacteria bacterium]
MDLIDPLAWAIIFGSFLATAISSAFGIGGGFVMIAIISSVLPISAMVPVHATMMVGMSLSRTWYFRKDIHWPIVIPFTIGALIGALSGTFLYVDLPEYFIAASVAVLMLLAVWLPDFKFKREIPHPFFLIGLIHSFLSALFSFGGLFQPVMVRTKLNKLQITATLAAGLMCMNMFKISGYILFGFDYTSYLAVILLSILVAFPAAKLGKALLHKISEKQFRIVFKVIMTVFAIRLLFRAWLLI